GRAAGKSEHEWIGERIAQERLQGYAGDRERGADLRGEDDAGDAEPEEHGRVRLAAGERVAERERSRAGRYAGNRGQRQDGEEHGDRQRGARGRRPPHLWSAAARSVSASGRRGPGWRSAVDRSVVTRVLSSPGIGERPGGA